MVWVHLAGCSCALVSNQYRQWSLGEASEIEFRVVIFLFGWNLDLRVLLSWNPRVVILTCWHDILCKLFDKMYLSHELGLRKPDIKIFEYILKEQKLKAEEVFFIDDSPQHIASAKKIGIHCHHLLDDENIINLFPGIIL